jgi:hypothetical protein
LNNFNDFLELMGILIVSGMAAGTGFIIVVAVAFWLRNNE